MQYIDQYKIEVLCAAVSVGPLWWQDCDQQYARYLRPFAQTQGRRNVFTTGPAKLNHEDYVIKYMGGDNFMNIKILFLLLIL